MQENQDILAFLNNIKRKYLSSNPELKILSGQELPVSDIRLFHIEELPAQDSVTRVYEQKNLLNILGQQSTLVIYLIHSTADGFEYYYGIVPDLCRDSNSQTSAMQADISEELFIRAMDTYYPNASYTKLQDSETTQLLDDVRKQQFIGTVEGIPALYQESALDMELNRLVQSLSGREFYLCMIARPLNALEQCELEACLQQVSNEISALANQTVTTSVSTNCTNNNSSVASTTLSNSKTQSRNRNFQSNIFLEYPEDEEEENDTAGNGETSQEEELEDIALDESETPGDIRSGIGDIDLEDILAEEGLDNEEKTEEKTESQSPQTSTLPREERSNLSQMERSKPGRTQENTWKQKIVMQNSTSVNKDSQNQSSKTDSKPPANTPQTFKVLPGQPLPDIGDIQFKNYNVSKGITINDICLKSIGGSRTNACIQASTRTVSKVQTISNQNAVSWLSYVKAYLQERLDAAKGNALYLCDCIILSDSYETYEMAAMKTVSNSATQQANQVPLRAFLLDTNSQLRNALLQLQIPRLSYGMDSKQCMLLPSEAQVRTAFAQWLRCLEGYYGNWYSSRELAVKTALPTVSASGFTNREATVFSMSIPEEQEEVLTFGQLEYQGGNTKPPELSLPYSTLHGISYIFGDSISGNVRTLNEFLLYSDIVSIFLNFYGVDIGYGDVVAFEQVPRRTVSINPLTISINLFQFYQGESIQERIDYIMECLRLAFPLDESSLYRFQTAAYECYADQGWNLSTNEYTKSGDPYSEETDAFPTLSDVLIRIESDLKSLSIGQRLLNEYLNKIKIHLGGLTYGQKGNLFNARHTMNLSELTNQNAIIDFTVLKNQNERVFAYCLVMLELMKHGQRDQQLDKKKTHLVISDGIEHLYGNTTKEYELRIHTQIWKELFENAAKNKEGVMALSRHTKYFPQEMLESANMVFCNKLSNQEETEILIQAGRINHRQAAYLRKLKEHQMIASCKERCYLFHTRHNMK